MLSTKLTSNLLRKSYLILDILVGVFFAIYFNIKIFNIIKIKFFF